MGKNIGRGQFEYEYALPSVPLKLIRAYNNCLSPLKWQRDSKRIVPQRVAPDFICQATLLPGGEIQ